MHNSILKITNKRDTYLATGFVIDKDHGGVYVATCGHVIDNCADEIVVEGLDAEIVKNENENGIDLAVLYVKGLDCIPLDIASGMEVDTVKVIGYSKLSGTSKKEPINDIRTKCGITFFTKQTISSIKLYPKESISDGYSGSPVICQTSFQVVGIVNIQVGDDTNYAICAKHLLDIYETTRKTNLENLSILGKNRGLITKIGKTEHDNLTKHFETLLDESLRSFSTQPKVWVEPRLHTKEEDTNKSSDKDTKVHIADIVLSPKSMVIQARQQFGLTCLANYLIKEAWVSSTPSFWLYLDSNELKPHVKEIKKCVDKKLKTLGLSLGDIGCIVLDEFSSNIKDANKIISKLCEHFDNLPIIIMMTLVENPLLNESIDIPENRNFDTLHLWALPRHDVRKIIHEYNNEKYIGDENSVVKRIISDLDVLNIPRTALNCLTILKIYEVEFDDSPVNRTEMIHRVLFLLFNVDDVPHYKTKPDLKDTEYILGYFCELMIREKNYYFTRDYFLKSLNDFCKSCELELDIHVIFDVLYSNHILVSRGELFCFKFSYWVFYFSAHRMHHNSVFADFILSDMNYISYPELIEFYTGIDRRRDDALKILVKDINCTRNIVEQKCGLPSDFNIYNLAQWKPSEEQVDKMHSELASGVLSSNLPDTVKDQYADQDYDRTRPLTQSIHTILENYSLLRLMKGVTAGSKALRNSDYSNTSIRHELLQEVLCGWEQIIKVLIVITPILAKHGRATLEGASFALNGNFVASPEEKFNLILQILPTNVVDWYKDDLFSKKMGPLLYKHLDQEQNSLIKHALNLLIINKRPKGWDKYIEKYIVSESKNSFYIYDVYQTLRAEYEYGFLSNISLGVMEKLIKMTAAKHKLGAKKPGSKMISKIPDSVLPNRDEHNI